ncbi:MAG: PKD domain-containing protein, partial [Candidatus Thermoplasmatota archaeon]|nr:PKD domain-containing protein [Candidatus Thermoplasmatota archaeon]
QWSHDPVATHLYLTVGDQTVTVEVRDPLGHIATASRDIEHEWVNKVPVPVLALEVDKVLVGQTVKVNGSLSTDPDTVDTLAFRFDWGDGSATGWSPSPVATHVYDDPGKYIITLTVRDDHGAEKDMTSTLQVKSKDDDDDGGFIPHPGVTFALAALTVVGLLMLMSRGRRKGS